MPSRCIFCSKNQLTEEDIWPTWFKRYMTQRHPRLSGNFQIVRMQGDETTILQAKSQTVGGKRRIMCGRCNNRRFGPLQESASDIIKPMLDLPFDNKSPEGNITLTIPDQHILAAWVTMTAMTSEFLPLPMPDNDETYFTQDQRIKFRRTQRPLKGMIVSSNQYVGRNATGAYFSHSFPNILDPATEAPTGQTAELYVITLNLFHVCFQIAFYPRPNMRFAHDGHTLLGIGADPPGLTVPLWPTTASQERPAKYSLGDETFVDYCTRWHPENPAGLAVDDSAPE